jgi:hypothetical protein
MRPIRYIQGVIQYGPIKYLKRRLFGGSECIIENGERWWYNPEEGWKGD